MRIYCCECGERVSARLTNGAEIYPRRPDLSALPFWKCAACGNYVGCHHKTDARTKPLGCIPNAEVREARKRVHALIDPAWKSGRVSRSSIYGHLTIRTGRQFHTAHIRSVEEAEEVIRVAKQFLSSLPC